MKKTIALLLALILSLSLAMSTSAETGSVTMPDAKIVMGTAEFTQKGEIKTLTVRAENFTPVTILQITVTYDKTKLKLLDVAEAGEGKYVKNQVKDAVGAFAPNATISNPVEGEVEIVWDSLTPVSGSGVIAKLRFEYIGDITSGDKKTVGLDMVTTGESAPIIRGEAPKIENPDGTITGGDPPTITLPDVVEGPSGFGVSGTVTSFLDANGKVTIELLSGENVVNSAEVTGNTASYSIEGVVPGTYTMRVSKAKHATREYSITVADGDVIQDVKIHHFGDINGDGEVTTSDAARVYAFSNGKLVFTDYQQIIADVNGDGEVTTSDAARVYAFSNGKLFSFPVYK